MLIGLITKVNLFNRAFNWFHYDPTGGSSSRSATARHSRVSRPVANGALPFFGSPIPKPLHSRKLTWKPKKGSIKTTVLLKGGYMGFHVSLGECKP